MKIDLTTLTTKIGVSTVTMALVSVPGVSQSARTGVSNPEPVMISAQADEAATPVKGAKPSAAIPETSEGAATVKPLARHEGARVEAYGPYVPYKGGAGPGIEASGLAASGAGAEERSSSDPDAGIVTRVPERAGEMREGTLIRARIRQSLSTVTTVPGTTFTAELLEPVEKEGRVVLPVGAVIDGRVTQVHGGRRISGAAMLHLEPRTVTLPDGTHYVIHAQLIDTDQTAHTTVDREGTLVRRDHPRETLAAMSLSTGGAAAAGAVIGGGVGAAVGAGIGAGAGAIWWLKQDRQAVLPMDSRLVFSLTEPMALMPVSNGPISRTEPARVQPRTGSGNTASGIVE